MELVACRSVDDFRTRDAPDEIVSIRYQHYEEKRKGKIRLLSDTIKHGMLDSLKETFQQQHKS